MGNYSEHVLYDRWCNLKGFIDHLKRVNNTLRKKFMDNYRAIGNLDCKIRIQQIFLEGLEGMKLKVDMRTMEKNVYTDKVKAYVEIIKVRDDLVKMTVN